MIEIIYGFIIFLFFFPKGANILVRFGLKHPQRCLGMYFLNNLISKLLIYAFIFIN